MKSRPNAQDQRGLDGAENHLTIAHMSDLNASPEAADRNNPRQETFGAAYTLCLPEGEAAPVVFASPHSGKLYPETMISALRVPLMDLRRTEDAFVDELFSDTPQHGAALLTARYARSVLDLNRDPHELDPDMFSDGPPRSCSRPTPHLEAGLGCLPRIGASGKPIYSRQLTRREGEERLAAIHDVYHERLSRTLKGLHRLHGRALLIDCHSMPSVQPGRKTLSDIVLGDRFGSSCAPHIISQLETLLRREGLSVARNTPYAGGYTTRRYGRPGDGFHAVQIEIKRSLYMDENRLEPSDRFSELRAALDRAARNLIQAF